jgi:hypothetical protein
VPTSGATKVRGAEPELLDELAEELRHGVGREQVRAALGVPEPGQVDRDQPACGGQGGPDTPERQQAFRPGAGQHDDRAGRLTGMDLDQLAHG